MNPRFVLVKFVPDLARMEPRNVGVFLWANGKICARFLGESDADFIHDKETYRHWQAFWRDLIEQDWVSPRRGHAVSKKSPECIEALLTTQEGQYLLVDAGELEQRITKNEVGSATDFLFSELVAVTSRSKSEAAVGLAKRCDTVIHESGISKIKGFRRRFPVECAVYGAKQRFHFTYGIGNGAPLALFQRVLLSNELNSAAAALMLHEVAEGALIDRIRCAVLYKRSDVSSEDAERRHEWLSRLGTTIAVDDEDAPERIAELLPRIEIPEPVG